MGKIYIEFRTNCRQGSISGIHQGLCGEIIRRPEPFALEDTPQCLSNVEMRAVWWQKEQKKTTLLPYRSEFGNELGPMYLGIVQNNECFLTNAKGKPVEKVGNLVCRYAFACGESIITVVSVNHAEDVESVAFLRGDKNILTRELPAVRHIALCADMAFISKIKVNETFFCLYFEFLQLLGLIRIELRRGLSLGTFSYTSISRANADKKSLKVLSPASLPDACCHASFAFLTLCRSFSMAARTNSSSVQSIIGLRPRPGRVSKPSIPSDSKRFNHEFTDIWVISVCAPTAFEVNPCDFKSIARQRIRNAWLLPLRKPASNCRRSWSVSCITLIFAIMICFYAFTQK